jgi:hypothetical protein
MSILTDKEVDSIFKGLQEGKRFIDCISQSAKTKIKNSKKEEKPRSKVIEQLEAAHPGAKGLIEKNREEYAKSQQKGEEIKIDNQIIKAGSIEEIDKLIIVLNSQLAKAHDRKKRLSSGQ